MGGKGCITCVIEVDLHNSHGSRRTPSLQCQLIHCKSDRGSNNAFVSNLSGMHKVSRFIKLM